MIHTYKATTNGITVCATPIYLSEESFPGENFYVWAYQIKIENHSNKSVQLLKRHWTIIDNNAQKFEVKGDGVVGKQPTIQPNEVFEYASGTHLFAPSGVMRGEYQMQDENGKIFPVEIPTFSLDSSDIKPTLN
jgi:ApaG protein